MNMWCGIRMIRLRRWTISSPSTNLFRFLLLYIKMQCLACSMITPIDPALIWARNRRNITGMALQTAIWIIIWSPARVCRRCLAIILIWQVRFRFRRSGPLAIISAAGAICLRKKSGMLFPTWENAKSPAMSFIWISIIWITTRYLPGHRIRSAIRIRKRWFLIWRRMVSRLWRLSIPV